MKKFTRKRPVMLSIKGSMQRELKLLLIWLLVGYSRFWSVIRKKEWSYRIRETAFIQSSAFFLAVAVSANRECDYLKKYVKPETAAHVERSGKTQRIRCRL
jgi:hypothetical protein